MALFLITFIHLFPLFFRLGELCWVSCCSPILCYLHSTRARLGSFLSLGLYSFHLVLFHICITSVSLLRCSAFSCVSREFVIDCWSVFNDSCFYNLDLGEMRSLDIWLVLVVVSVNGPFSFQVGIFLIPWRVWRGVLLCLFVLVCFYFAFASWAFYYVMSLWVLLKSFIRHHPA